MQTSKPSKKKNEEEDTVEEDSSSSSSSDGENPYGWKQTLKRAKVDLDGFPKLTPDKPFNQWELEMLLHARTNFFQDVVDLDAPDPLRTLQGRAKKAYVHRNTLLYGVFCQTIYGTQHGPTILNKH